jgi:hypothetical protein
MVSSPFVTVVVLVVPLANAVDPTEVAVPAPCVTISSWLSLFAMS